mgnify:FL=1
MKRNIHSFHYVQNFQLGVDWQEEETLFWSSVNDYGVVTATPCESSSIGAGPFSACAAAVVVVVEGDDYAAALRLLRLRHESE